MENPALLPLRVRHGDGGGEVAIVVDPAVAAQPLVVPLARVDHGPGDDCVVLAVCRVTPGSFSGHAAANTLVLVAVPQLVADGAIVKPGKRIRTKKLDSSKIIEESFRVNISID